MGKLGRGNRVELVLGIALAIVIVIAVLEILGIPVLSKRRKPAEIEQNWNELVEAIAKLEIGDDQQAALELLGEPQEKSRVDALGRQTYTYWKLELDSAEDRILYGNWAFVIEFDGDKRVTRIDEIK